MPNSIHLHQKLSLDSLAWFVLSFTSVSSHWVYFVNENYAGFLGSSHSEQRFNDLFAFSDELTHDVTAGYAEECSFWHFMGASFGDESLSCAWGTIEEYSFPRFSVSDEHLGETHGHNDCFLECCFCFLKACNIVPRDIRSFFDDNTLQIVLYFWFLIFVGSIEHHFSFIIFYVITHKLEFLVETV